jgi:transcriptional regulator with XRE-family HTH domain
MNLPEPEFRHWRRQMGLTQAAAAELLGYGISRIAEYDRGEHDLPVSIRWAMSAAKAGLQPYQVAA